MPPNSPKNLGPLALVLSLPVSSPWRQHHPRSQALLAACVAISPGTNRTGTPQIVVFTGSKRANAASAYFFTRSGEVIHCVLLCFYSLYIVKYILLEATIGGCSHSLSYFIPGSYYFSHILSFILHTVISVSRQ